MYQVHVRIECKRGEVFEILGGVRRERTSKGKSSTRSPDLSKSVFKGKFWSGKKTS